MSQKTLQEQLAMRTTHRSGLPFRKPCAIICSSDVCAVQDLHVVVVQLERWLRNDNKLLRGFVRQNIENADHGTAQFGCENRLSFSIRGVALVEHKDGAVVMRVYISIIIWLLMLRP